MSDITGTSGDNNLNGGSGDDTMDGGAGNDIMSGGSGSDTMDGGSGSDRLNGGSGADTLIYTLAENTGATDIYTGGSGIDTIRLELTSAEWLRADVQTQIALYLQHLIAVKINQNTGEVSNGSASDFTFAFDGSARLTVQMMERLDVWVDGQQFDFHAPFISAADGDGAVTEDADDPTLSDSGTISFLDVDWTQTHSTSVAFVSGDSLGGSLTATVTNPANGDGAGVVTWNYSVSNSATQHLGAGETATATFLVTITDSLGKTDTQPITVTVTGTNDQPTLTISDSAGAMNEGDGAATLSDSGALSFTDLDTNDLVAVSQSLNSAPVWSNGTLSAGQIAALQAGFTVDQDSWDYSTSENLDFLGAGETISMSFDVVATDDSGAGNAASAVTTVAVTVTGTNDGPLVQAVAAVADEDGAAVLGYFNGDDVDSDDDTASLSYTITTALAPGQGSVVNNNDGSFSFNPGTDFQGLAEGETQLVTFDYTATDSHGAVSNTGTVTVTVTGTNDGPLVQAVAAVADEDGAAVLGYFNGDDVDSDDDTASLSYTITTALAPGQGSVVNNNDGSFSFNPGTDFQGLAEGETQLVTFDYTATDSHGAVSNTGTVTVTVTGTNDGPLVQAVAAVADEDGAAVLGYFNGDDVDSDDDTASLSYTITTALAPGQGSVVNNNDGSFSFNPGTDFQGLAEGETQLVTFDYTATDSHGAVSNTGTVTVTVTGTNDGPLVQAVAAVADEDGAAVLGYFNGDDVDSDDDTASLSYTITTALAPGQGSVVNNNDGSFSFNPGTDFQGLAEGETQLVTFDYTATDSHGAVSNTGTVTVTVTGTNDGPLVQAVAAVADEDGAAVLGYFNGDDVDSDDDTASLSYTITTALAPGQGSVVNNNDGSFSFNPGTDFQGLAEGETQLVTFDYTATDSHGAVSNTGTVTVTVTGTNDGPLVQAVAAVADEDGAAVLGYFNGDDVDSDDDTASLSYTITTALAPGQGSVVNNNDGSFSFNPGTDFQGLAEGETQLVTFDYTATDSHGAVSNTGTVTVTVTGTNDAPMIQLVTTDSASATLTETNLGLTAGGTLTVTDADTTDTVSSSVTGVVVSGTTAGLTLTNAQLQSLLGVAPTTGLAANSGDTHNLSWTFDSGTEAFNYLNDGQSLTLTYTVQSTDNHSVSDTQTITVTINGTNDNVAAIDLNFSATTSSGNGLPNGAFGQITAVDPDGGGAHTYAVTNLTATTLAGGAAANVAGDLTVSSAGVVSASNLDDDRIYSLSVEVTQGTATFAETFSVITGTNAANNISGSGDDVIFGRGQNDVILAGSGNDTVLGQAGDDTIRGGDGNDVLTGGNNNDTFVFDTALNGTTNVDTVTDFNANTADRIALDQSIFTVLALGAPLAAANFAANAGGDATQADDYILYDTATGNLYYDADGNGAGAKILFATLTLSGVSGTVDSSDFNVIA